MKFSHITPANLAKAANPPATDERVSKISNFSNPQHQQNDPQGETIDFYVDGAANLANPANPSDYTPTISKISDFSKGNTRKNADCSSVRCSDCRHGQPATPSDPWSWHLCGAGAIREHGWGMAPRRCERWEVAP